MHTRSGSVRVLVVDDHAVLRQGIAAMLAEVPGIEVVAEAEDGARAIDAYADVRPDLMLLDLQMPGMSGLDVIIQTRARWPDARIVVLTTYQGDAKAVRALKAGASGYLLKSSLRKELVDAIRAVHAGRKYILAEVAQEIAVHAADEPLSAREIAILELVAAGKGNKSVAHELGLSQDTIKGHLRSIFSKLDVTDRTQAVTVALRRGIITL